MWREQNGSRIDRLPSECFQAIPLDITCQQERMTVNLYFQHRASSIVVRMNKVSSCKQNLYFRVRARREDRSFMTLFDSNSGILQDARKSVPFTTYQNRCVGDDTASNGRPLNQMWNGIEMVFVHVRNNQCVNFCDTGVPENRLYRLSCLLSSSQFTGVVHPVRTVWKGNQYTATVANGNESDSHAIRDSR